MDSGGRSPSFMVMVQVPVAVAISLSATRMRQGAILVTFVPIFLASHWLI